MYMYLCKCICVVTMEKQSIDIYRVREGLRPVSLAYECSVLFEQSIFKMYLYWTAMQQQNHTCMNVQIPSCIVIVIHLNLIG